MEHTTIMVGTSVLSTRERRSCSCFTCTPCNYIAMVCRCTIAQTVVTLILCAHVFLSCPYGNHFLGHVMKNTTMQ